MRIFFFVRRNNALKSGMSSKIWKIERKERVVTVWWGAAKWDSKARRVRSRFELQSKTFRFSSEAEAIRDSEARIAEKIGEGYERSPRSRKHSNVAKPFIQRRERQKARLR
jgi:hypothetical protein